MRKINYNLARALEVGRPCKWKSSASEVLVTPHGSVLLYHGSAIAHLTKDKQWLRITLAGYDTRTTKDRVNAVLRYLGTDYAIVHRKGQLKLLLPHPQPPLEISSTDMLLFKAAFICRSGFPVDFKFDERIPKNPQLRMPDGEEETRQTKTENTE